MSDRVFIPRVHGATISSPTVVMGAIPTIYVYNVTESELETLEHGSQGALLLNIGLSCFAFGVAFLIAVLTITFTTPELTKMVVFWLCAIFGIGAGIILLIIGARSLKPTKELCDRIRARVPSSPEASSGS